MTTGNLVSDNLNTVMCVYNGSPLTTSKEGSYRKRQWLGGDDPQKGLPQRQYTEHEYWTTKVGKYYDGRRIVRYNIPKRRTYRTYNRVVHDRGLHEYDSEFVREWTPVSTFDSKTVIDSNGTVLNSGVFTNTPVRLFIGSASAAPTPALTPQDQWRAISRLREQIAGTPFNLAVSLGELKETLGMIGETARKLAMSVSHLKRGRFKAALRELNDPRAERYGVRHGANPYLEVTYGWTPLLSDIRNGAEWLSHRLNVPLKRRYSVTVRSDENVNDGFTGSIDIGGRKWSCGGYSLMTRRIVAYISEQPGLWGTLGFSDPASIIWELTPYSFVADWVLPVGDYLEARASADLLQGKFVQTDLLRKKLVGPWEGVFKDPSIYGGVTNTIRGDSPGSSLEYARVTRTVLSYLNVPMPSVKSLKTDYSWRHAASGLALMVQAFAGSGKTATRKWLT